MNKEKVFEYAHSLPKEEFSALVNELCLRYPLNTRELSQEIAHAILNDCSMKEEKFQSIVDARKNEHAALVNSYRENVRRISSMKSKDGLDPYEIFPEEIWEYFFKFLTPSEKFSFLNVHGRFSDLLNDNKIRDVFIPLVIGCKFLPFWKPENEDGEDVAVTYYLAENFELRMISKNIRSAIDIWYENNLLHDLRSMKQIPRGVVTINLEKLEDCVKVANFVDHLNGRDRNFKFFTRSLKIVSPAMGDYSYESSQKERKLFEEMDAKLIELLEQIGDHIWFFHFEYAHPSYHMRIPSTVKELPERYNSCLEWLSRMPNLRWMIMSIDPIQMEPHLVVENRWLWDPYQLSGRRIAPVLYALERLDLELTEKNVNPLSIFNHFLQSYRHVKYLKLTGLNCMFESEGSVLHPNSDYPGVSLEPTTLSIHVAPTLPDQEDDSYFDDDDDQGNGQLESQHDNGYAILHSVISKAWPLKRLELRLAFNKVSLHLLFDVIAMVKTLEDVRLSATNPIIGEGMHCIEIPNLTHFEFALQMTEAVEKTNVWGMFFSLHYLILNGGIRSLHIDFDMLEDCWIQIMHETTTAQYIGKRVDFDKAVLSLLGLIEGETITEKKSNIWTIFRKLNQVKLRLVLRDVAMEIKKYVSKETYRSGLTSP